MQQQRGYFDIETYVIKKQNISKTWLWCLKIDGIYYHGRKLEEFIELLNKWPNAITLWAFNLTKYEASYLKPAFFLRDDVLKYYVNEDLLENERKKRKKNMWTDMVTEYGNNTMKITWYNNLGKKITFLCAWLMVGKSGNLKRWGEVFNLQKGITPLVDSQIENVKILPKNYYDYVNRDVDIVEKMVEKNLELLEYDQKEYKLSLASYATWWWQKHSTIDLKYFYRNKIKNYEIWQKLKTAFRGGYNFVAEKYTNKVIKWFGKDMKSAYPFQLVSKPTPVFEPLECEINNCEHRLSIKSITYYNFKIRDKKLPIFLKREDFTEFYRSGTRIPWSAINEEHELIDENYDYEYKTLNWKYCFEKREYLFYEYFYFWFKRKEENVGIIKEYSKIYNNCLWGGETQNPIKNNKIFIWQKEMPTHKSQIAYPSKLEGYYVEKILNHEQEPDKYFNSWKCKYLPLGIFTTSYQRIDIIRGGQLNFDKLIGIDTDCLMIKGEEKDFIEPNIYDLNLPDWAKKLKLGKFTTMGTTQKYDKNNMPKWSIGLSNEEFSKLNKAPFIKIIAPKNYLLINENNNVIKAVVSGLSKEQKVVDSIVHELYQKGAVIIEGTSKSQRLKHGGVLIETGRDFKVKDKRKSSIF